MILKINISFTPISEIVKGVFDSTTATVIVDMAFQHHHKDVHLNIAYAFLSYLPEQNGLSRSLPGRLSA